MATQDTEMLILSPTPGEERALSRAISLWAGGTTRPETRDREDKLQDKIAAVRRFFAFAGKHPGEVTPEDLERWRRHLEGRGQKPATVYARISRLSSFYNWLLAHPQLRGLTGANPVAQARPRCPHPYQSE